MTKITMRCWTGTQTAVDRLQMKTTNAAIGAARRGGQAA
jgi:hypothetical protein